MNPSKKIQAFSLIELVVVMILSGIVTGMVYYTYFIANKSFIRFLENRKQKETFCLMTFYMERDFFRSDSIIFNERIVNCYYNREAVKYYFLESGIVRRQSNLADTLRIKIDELICNFDYDVVQSGWIDELLIKHRVGKDKNVLHMYKQYDAVSMLSHKNKYVNRYVRFKY